MDYDVEPLQILLDNLYGVDVDLIKKRHIFYIWMYFYMENMSFITFFETSCKTISSDYKFFIENYVKHNYILLYKKNDFEKLNNYINIMKGKKDIIIETYINDDLKVKVKKRRWCCFKI